jgi:hypothetical protein
MPLTGTVINPKKRKKWIITKHTKLKVLLDDKDSTVIDEKGNAHKGRLVLKIK